MEMDIAAALAQLGAAGIIGWMWLSERRAAAARERQLGDLHERLMQERPQLAALIEVVRDNTRALTAVEAGHRAIAAAIDRLTRQGPPRATDPRDEPGRPYANAGGPAGVP